MPSNTNNLNLYKKNSVTDGNDTFNLETMLNENWDKVDAAFSVTADSAQVPTGLSGKLSQWVSWLTNRIKAITGKQHWYDTPSITLETASGHINAAAPHPGHETPAGAQAKANAVQNNLSTHLADNTKHGIMTDTTTNKKYQLGTQNGLLYYKEVI